MFLNTLKESATRRYMYMYCTCSNELHVQCMYSACTFIIVCNSSYTISNVSTVQLLLFHYCGVELIHVFTIKTTVKLL